jgi:threonine synthase
MPTGSFKDRGAALVVGHLKRCGALGIVEDSSGNAGAAFSAYAAAAGLPCTIYAPASTSSPKLRQIEIHGARLRLVEGSREETADRARTCPAAEGVYGGHNWQPFFVEGCKTIAYELWEGLGFRAPAAAIVPVGGGANLLGIHVGFSELLRAGSIERLPRIYGIQAKNCAPLVAAFRQNARQAIAISARPTIAEGITITNPPRGAQILAAVRESGGAMLAVEESEILAALERLLGCGLSVEPTSAVALAGLTRLIHQGDLPPEDESVVVLLTGSGLKSIAQVIGLLGRGRESSGDVTLGAARSSQHPRVGLDGSRSVSYAADACGGREAVRRLGRRHDRGV